MIKKLFLLTTFVFLISVLFVKVTHATNPIYDCQMSPTDIPYNATSFQGEIKAGGGQRLAPNTEFELYIYDEHDYDCRIGGGNDIYCYSHIRASTDSNGVIRFTATKQQGPGYLRQNSKVVVHMEHPNQNTCKDIKISTTIPTSSGSCLPIQSKTINSGGSNQWYIKPSNLSSSGSYKVAVNSCPNGVNAECSGSPILLRGEFGNNCVPGSELTSGDGLLVSNSVGTGKYTVWINSCALIGEQNLCNQTFDVGQEGVDPVEDGSALCPYCPSGTTWSYPNQKCIQSDSALIDPLYENCGGGTLCIPGHTEKDGIRAICSPTDFEYGEGTTARDAPCPTGAKSGETCEYITTDFGVDIPTSFAGFASTIFGIILSLGGGIALILIIISGYRIMASQGNPESLQQAKEQLTAAIVGLLFVIFSLVFLEVIGVNILNLPGFN